MNLNAPLWIQAMSKRSKQQLRNEAIEIAKPFYVIDGYVRGLTYTTLPSVAFRRVQFPDLNRNPYAGFEKDLEKISSDFRAAARKSGVRSSEKKVVFSGS